MHITWHGLSCVKIQTSTGQLLINPFQDSVGINMPKLKVDVVATTDPHNDMTNNIDRLQGDPRLVLNPGEYESHDMFIYGVPAPNERSLFVVETEGITIGHPGLITSELNEAQLEIFEGIDILFLPITGLAAKNRSDFIAQVDPRVIIPIHYSVGKAKVNLDPIDAFIKEVGKGTVTEEKKYIAKANKLPVEETHIIVLEQQ